MTPQLVPVPGTDLSIPLLTAKGARPGKTLLVSAGVHGDEYEGTQALFDVWDSLNPAAMSGTLLAVPVANPPAFWSVSRTSPPDQGNLARAFPGSPDGTQTERIAHYFDTELLPRADFLLDLHSGGIRWSMPTLVGFHQDDAAARAAAAVFGAPVIWEHPEIGPGRTLSAARARGIPSLYGEARGGGRIHPEDVAVYRRGILQLMRHLEILSDPADPVAAPVRLRGDGNIDAGLAATRQGFLTSHVNLLDAVAHGQPLGTLRDLCGRILEVITAPRAGVIALIHSCPVVQAGEPMFLITDQVP